MSERSNDITLYGYPEVFEFGWAEYVAKVDYDKVAVRVAELEAERLKIRAILARYALMPHQWTYEDPEFGFMDVVADAPDNVKQGLGEIAEVLRTRGQTDE